jgi:two-component system chemotaxis sensor kinase CheA
MFSKAFGGIKTGRIIDLDFRTVRDENDAFLFITLILTDKTQEIINKNMANKMQEYAQMVVKVIGDRKTTLDSVSQMQRLFFELKEALLRKEVTHDVMVGIKRLLHTIKGAGDTYFFGDLGRKINEIELKLNEIADDHEMFQLVKNEGNHLFSSFESYLKQINDLISDKNDERSTCSKLSEKSKSLLMDFIKKGEGENFTKDQILDGLYNQFILSPLHDYLMSYSETVKDLAKSLKKPIPLLKVSGENIGIDYESYAEFFSELIHIFRNIMDHGLEFESERLARKKAVEGKILVHTEMIVSDGIKKLKFAISDDGNGIDTEKIKNKLLQTEKYKDIADRLSNEELMNFIFGHGFSTVEKKNEISGQGVGLDALKGVVEKMEGSIKVDSEFGKGTSFIIILPLTEKSMASLVQ